MLNMENQSAKNISESNIAVIILTYNAVNTINLLLSKIGQQSFQPTKIIVVDSSSTDQTLEKIKKFPQVKLVTIKKNAFDHGTTRKFATTLIDADFYIFLTQDAIPANKEAFYNLMQAFNDPRVGCAYGRQLPNPDAAPIASHIRLFNYPAESSVKSLADRDKYGYKTLFNSDSFAAYRKSALLEVDNFPEKTILCEDTYVAAKMLLAGWKVAYQASAEVFHSHNYSLFQYMKFCFDIGVFHKKNPWILENFSGLNSEGFRYFKSELYYCYAKGKYLTIFKSCLKQVMSFVGYKLGKHYQIIPNNFRKKLSLCSFYW